MFFVAVVQHGVPIITFEKMSMTELVTVVILGV